jgi:hypothetical protein
MLAGRSERGQMPWRTNLDFIRKKDGFTNRAGGNCGSDRGLTIGEILGSNGLMANPEPLPTPHVSRKFFRRVI